jgi:hypothetical protein
MRALVNRHIDIGGIVHSANNTTLKVLIGTGQTYIMDMNDGLLEMPPGKPEDSPIMSTSGEGLIAW